MYNTFYTMCFFHYFCISVLSYCLRDALELHVSDYVVLYVVFNCDTCASVLYTCLKSTCEPHEIENKMPNVTVKYVIIYLKVTKTCTYKMKMKDAEHVNLIRICIKNEYKCR